MSLEYVDAYFMGRSFPYIDIEERLVFTKKYFLFCFDNFIKLKHYCQGGYMGEITGTGTANILG